MGHEARLCDACRKYTLQTLYRGTGLYSLGTECDLCELIRPEVVSHYGLSEGDELPVVSLQVFDEERVGPIQLSSAPEIFHEMTRYFIKERLHARFPRTTKIVKMREHPFARLQVFIPREDDYHENHEITQLKVTPLEGRSLISCLAH